MLLNDNLVFWPPSTAYTELNRGCTPDEERWLRVDLGCIIKIPPHPGYRPIHVMWVVRACRLSWGNLWGRQILRSRCGLSFL